MSLWHPVKRVEWTSDWSEWNEISDEVLEFHLRRCDLTLGPWTFELLLDNRRGKYSLSTFPPIDPETGLHKGLRFYVNGKIRMMGRMVECDPQIEYGLGDIFIIRGFGFGQETVNKEAYPDSYPAYRGDDIIYDQCSHVGLDDCLYSASPHTAPRTHIYIPETGMPRLRDVIVETAENIGYVAYFKSTEKPAPFQFFPKNDAAKQLNVVLRSVLPSQENNLLRCRQPRTIASAVNYLRLDQYKGEDVYFRTDLPYDRDAWTDGLDFAYIWAVTAGTLELDGDDKNVGDYSIKCTGSASAPPDFRLLIPNSGYGVALNPDHEQVDRIVFDHKEVDTLVDMQPRVCLVDDQNNEIYYSYSPSYSWAGLSVGVGAANIGLWSGDTAAFNWNIEDVRFRDAADHSSQPSDTPIIRVDGLYLHESGGYEQLYLQDATSITNYGKRQDHLSIPLSFPFLNTYRWGLQKLDALKEPLRITSLRAALDPSLVKEDDDSTPADVLPGWSLQLDVPRFKLKKVSDGGVWWRILSAEEHWQGPPNGYTFIFELVPTVAEVEDHSRVTEDRLLDSRDAYAARISRLIKKERILRSRI